MEQNPNLELTDDEVRALGQVLNEALNGIGLTSLVLAKPVNISFVQALASELRAMQLEATPSLRQRFLSKVQVYQLLELCISVRQFVGDEELATRVGITPPEYTALVDRLAAVVGTRE